MQIPTSAVSKRFNEFCDWLQRLDNEDIGIRLRKKAEDERDTEERDAMLTVATYVERGRLQQELREIAKHIVQIARTRDGIATRVRQELILRAGYFTRLLAQLPVENLVIPEALVILGRGWESELRVKNTAMQICARAQAFLTADRPTGKSGTWPVVQTDA